MSWSLYRVRHDGEYREAMLPVLATLLASDDIAIKQRAMRAVATIGHCDTPGALADLVPLVCTASHHEDELTRRTAISALFAIGRDNPEIAVPALIRACDDEQLLQASMLALIEIGEAARPAAACFRRFAGHSHGKIRRLVMRGLGAINAHDEESRRVLLDGLRDPHQRVQEMAQRVLKQIEAQQ